MHVESSLLKDIKIKPSISTVAFSIPKQQKKHVFSSHFRQDEGLGSADRYQLSHEQLLQRVRLLETVLRHRGAEETIVAVCLQRTPALVVALLGILFAGRVVLIDVDRVGLVGIEEVGAWIVLVQASLH